MPFSDTFKDIYELGIKAACHAAGAYCERVDEQIFQDSILERVYNQIATADIIIADMTGRNPNVFYETGYAHALNKRVILLTQHTDDIPFDLKHYPHIVYESRIIYLKEELTKRVKWCVDNPQTSLASVDVSVELLGNGHDLSKNPIISEEDIGDTLYVIPFALQIHNLGTVRIDSDSCSVGLVIPSEIFQPHSSEVQKQGFPGVPVYKAGGIDEQRAMIEFPLSRPLLPDARETFNVYLGLDHRIGHPVPFRPIPRLAAAD